MEFSATVQDDDTTSIRIRTDDPVAVVAESSAGEHVYLPPPDGTDRSYYESNPVTLQETEDGYETTHPEPIESLRVFS